jgi:hypothetical protein
MSASELNLVWHVRAPAFTLSWAACMHNGVAFSGTESWKKTWVRDTWDSCAAAGAKEGISRFTATAA